MVGVAKEHESTRLLAACYLMALHAGLVNGITFLNPHANTFTSHVSGTSNKAAMWFVDGRISDDGGPAVALIVSFLAGSISSGVVTGFPKYKTIQSLVITFLMMAVLLGVAAVLMIEEYEEFKYIAAFTLGLQNAMITTTSGFARTTHVTGTVTDIGILIGNSANPAVRTNEAHWWKCRALSYLLLNYMLGAAIALFVTDKDYMDMQEYALLVPAGMSLLMGTLGSLHLWQERAKAAAGQRESLKKSQMAAKLKTVSTTSAICTLMMRQLAEETPNVESMPDGPGARAVRKIGKAAGIVSYLKTSGNTRKLKLMEDASKEELKVQEVMKLFDFLASKPGLMKEIQEQQPHLAEYLDVAKYYPELKEEMTGKFSMAIAGNSGEGSRRPSREGSQRSAPASFALIGKKASTGSITRSDSGSNSGGSTGPQGASNKVLDADSNARSGASVGDDARGGDLPEGQGNFTSIDSIPENRSFYGSAPPDTLPGEIAQPAALRPET
uniref:Uncharacterized protein n=1 Tax=Pyramimonas obovata TaxID=1411642 RepID=A0A7S0R9R5_9CHLO|mmetsp:Transcript_28678/g.62812  ORF Transcript_28678/g.62812 Transcript_28678/m.62812 type:complete len:498 (+) Transcript_28678:150-1643(+)|eukprot:CAMPEP_0118945894 /NCGR_PEP_ID=MMETSP1169-20130426/43201_1 /TAXON_ID=36882 /ORGANISM="Pyramimonas obovata, Strain CCMP722" /LENGTH=497 /DNA_ID=CAMNT_0006891727 /DNA_START=43 /DNA_END=1536 /DNA_ORIENTATION=+